MKLARREFLHLAAGATALPVLPRSNRQVGQGDQIRQYQGEL